MSSERKILNIWTCDACGETTTVDDSGSGYPGGWHQVASAPITARLGNTPSKHLCPNCTDWLGKFLANRIGDTGDMAEAWDEGHQAGSMVEYDGRIQPSPRRRWTVRVGALSRVAGNAHRGHRSVRRSRLLRVADDGRRVGRPAGPEADGRAHPLALRRAQDRLPILLPRRGRVMHPHMHLHPRPHCACMSTCNADQTRPDQTRPDQILSFFSPSRASICSYQNHVQTARANDAKRNGRSSMDAKRQAAGESVDAANRRRANEPTTHPTRAAMRPNPEEQP